MKAPIFAQNERYTGTAHRQSEEENFLFKKLAWASKFSDYRQNN